MLNRILVIISGLMFSSVSLAAGEAAPKQSVSSMILMFVVFIVIFYFLLIRPQQKKAKDQRKLMDDISVGDEVITAGGILGKITKLRDNFVVLHLGQDTEITLQKSSISSILPKGTLESSS
jgi:preprotein translocase subunit YajC